MKRIIICSIITSLLVIAACKKENQYPSKTVDVTYPMITLKGDSIVSIPVGTDYTDAGATLTDDITGASSDIEAIDNPVDKNTPGLYMVTYMASNANGFKTIKQRPVAVTDISPSWDLTGQYERTANGVIIDVAKVANGLYVIDNVGGVDLATAASVAFKVYMAQLDDSTITVPYQVVADGSVLGGIDASLSASPGDTSFTYIVDNISFGTSPRTFVKQ